MNINELLKTEGRNVEFKVDLPKRKETFLKTVVAFANCQGGFFVFGVSDVEHAVIGMNDETLFQDMDTLTNIISDNCEPTIMPNVYPVTVKGRSLIIVEICTGRQRPYYIKTLGMMDGTYYRVSAETRKADECMVKELMFEGAHRFFDKTVCLGLEVSDGDIAALCQSLHEKALFYQAPGGGNTPIREVSPTQLLSWGILTKHESRIVPTNAYALLTGHYLLPSMIQCALFRGTTKNVFLDRRDYEGPIFDQQEKAYQFVLRNIKLGARITGLYRQDVYEIPPAVIREILVNAVVHRSYLATGNIQVALFDDRLEVLSPGKLPMDQSIESMRSGFSKIRNEALARAFAYIGLIEGWGSGIPKVNALLKKAGLKELEISGGDFYLKFTVYRNQDFNPMAEETPCGKIRGNTVSEAVGDYAGDRVVDRAGDHVGDHVGDNRCRESVILGLLSGDSGISAKEISLRLHVSTRTVERILRQLKQSGKIDRVGSARSGQWIVKEPGQAFGK